MANKKSTGGFKLVESPNRYDIDDGLETPEVGAWSERKYELVHFYDRLFATGMKTRWETRVYLDLYSGAGKVKIEGTRRVVAGSPLLALDIPDKFDKYIFCEKNPTKLDALRTRVSARYPALDVQYVPGDCNTKISEIIGHIPSASRTNKVLTFCFVDPFSLNIRFDTIRSLAESRFVDFLILLAFSDATRNESRYIEQNDEHIDNFLGSSDWRNKWLQVKNTGVTFVRFLAEEYVQQMIKLDYRRESLETMMENRSDDRNLSLYHLAFFSRHERGYDFWRKVRRYGPTQGSLFE